MLEYFSRGKAVNLDTHITANTQTLVRFPQVYLRAFCHQQNMTKSSNKSRHQRFLHSNYSVRGVFKGGSWVRELSWSQMQLFVTILIQESLPISGGLAGNPTYFSAVSPIVTVPGILVSVLQSFCTMGSVRLVLVVLEACVTG